MNLLQKFVDYLVNLKNQPSLSTIKNYKADIGQFIKWFEMTLNIPFDSSFVFPQTLYDYKNFRKLSSRSFERHMSSLRKYFAFLKSQGATVNIFSNKEKSTATLVLEDPWKIRLFKNFLYEYNKSGLTIKNYINDIKGFFIWLKEVAAGYGQNQIDNDSLLSTISSKTIEKYKERLIAAKFSPATVNRKLSSLRNYISWAKKQNFIPDQKQPEINNQNPQAANAKLDAVPGIKKEFYAPLDISTKYFPIHAKIWHYIRHYRPAWYKKYHSYRIPHYFHFAILTLISCAMGFGLYNYMFPKKEVLGTTIINAPAPTAVSFPYLTLSDKTLSLTSPSKSNFNIQIIPDGNGVIDIQKPIQNRSNNNNFSLTSGFVEITDSVAILASTSAQSALYINQNSMGKLISAHVKEIAKFSVDEKGSGTFAGDLIVGSGNLTSPATAFNFLDSRITNLKIGGEATTITLPSYAAKGGVLYTDESGIIYQTPSSTSLDCLVGGSFPYFTPCIDILKDDLSFWDKIIDQIKEELISASEVITDKLTVTADSVKINGTSLKDYVIHVLENAGLIDPEIISPLISTNRLAADIISPLSSPDLTVSLASPSGSLIIKNGNSEIVTRIDNAGNALFTGDVNALSLTANDATIGGTLRAKSILADSIEGLEARITNFLDVSTYSAQFTNTHHLIADNALVNQELTVLGNAYMFDLSVIDELSIGNGSGNTIYITANSIDTPGTELLLQGSKAGGISMMAGDFYIDTNGNVYARKNLTVDGKLTTKDLLVSGNMISTGSATLAKLNFSSTQSVLALSDTEIVASSSAGTASISPLQSEVTIYNSLLTDNSVIYITPVGTPSGKVPFLTQQNSDKSFTVGISPPTAYPVPFSWLIVN